MVTPLKLKSERVGKVIPAQSRPYLSVLVDTGVYHLDQPFDYLLPEKYSLNPGQWVSVPFNGRNCQGLIIDRGNRPTLTTNSKILPINRGIKGAEVSKEHLEFYQSVAARWAVPIFDVLRFVSKQKSSTSQFTGNGKRSYLQLAPGSNELEQVRKLANRLAKSGPTLVIVPEGRSATALEGENFEVGMRGSSLSPNFYVNLIVLREESELHYEIKSPGFNTRDVTLLRNQILGENLIFAGFSPSLEMSRLIDTDYIPLKKANARMDVIAKASNLGELIPSSLIKPFKESLAKGPALVVVPSKGYGVSISCAACRNIAKCGCGGKLSKRSKNEDPYCVICSKVSLDWRCNFCGKNRIFLLGRGIERIAEEFGRTFPNTAIHIATAEKDIEGEIPRRSIVLATVGAVPMARYSSVLFLEGLNHFADLRSEERFLSTLFRYSALCTGKVLMVERPEYPAVNALTKWNPFGYLNRIVGELADSELPPFTRHILIKSEDSESGRIFSGIQNAIRESRLPVNTRIFNVGDGIISIFFTLRNSKKITSFFYELQRRRSMSGKAPLKMRIDPYLLG